MEFALINYHPLLPLARVTARHGIDVNRPTRDMSEIENDVQESVVSSEAPSEASSEPNKSSETVETKSPTEKYVPYDRFNEVIQQKNEHAKALEEQRKQFADLQAKFSEFSRPKEAPKANPLIERLKGIDPEFGKWAESQEKSRAELEELRSWKSQSEQQRTAAEVSSSVEKLHTEYKVPAEARELYTDLLRSHAARIEATGKVLGLQDLPNLYKQVHDSLGKLNRTNLATYTQAKKVDATVPAQTKGPAPKVAPAKMKFSNNKDEARSQIVKAALEQFRAHKNAQ